MIVFWQAYPHSLLRELRLHGTQTGKLSAASWFATPLRSSTNVTDRGLGSIAKRAPHLEVVDVGWCWPVLDCKSMAMKLAGAVCQWYTAVRVRFRPSAAAVVVQPALTMNAESLVFARVSGGLRSSRILESAPWCPLAPGCRSCARGPQGGPKNFRCASLLT